MMTTDTETVFDVLPSDDALEGATVLAELLAGHFERQGAVQAHDLAAAWASIDEASWQTLGVAENDGGFGLGLRDLSHFAVTAGRVLAPIPLVQSWALAHDAHPVTVAIPRAGDPDRIRIPDGLFPGIRVVNADLELPGLDGVSDDPFPRVWETRAHATPLDPEQVRRLVVLWASESVGAVSALVDDTVAYAHTREQFGHPIGKLQAVKHLVARAEWLRQEALTGVTWMRSEQDAVGAAELVMNHCLSISEIVGQAHGGIGMTWELGHHYVTRRLVLLRSLVGDLHAWHAV